MINHESKEKYTALRDVIADKTKKIFSFNKWKSTSPKNIEQFWALKEINFDVNQGDRIGIVGRNGAGKSTLLKILSRITESTSGSIKIKGRIASLLEVGTGFHPELTGKENIYLNGAILGMSKNEINKHFDAIVDFAEIERFLDTPVKKYSSGMYVRLAFAVAAHLEPEILIIDEVLAVGDAQFQKKCIGKMEDVSKNEGRTILFVSHNMGVVSTFCNSAILLNKGTIDFIGNTQETINKYLRISEIHKSYHAEITDKDFYVSQAEVLNSEQIPTNNFKSSESIHLKIKINKNISDCIVRLSVTIQNNNGDYINTFVENMEDYFSESDKNKEFLITYPADLLSPNHFSFRLALFTQNGHVFDLVEMICPVNVIDSGSKMAIYEGINYGYFNANQKFTVL
jgi:lipopolysaccharide transport system ATP-binding protein